MDVLSKSDPSKFIYMLFLFLMPGCFAVKFFLFVVIFCAYINAYAVIIARV